MEIKERSPGLSALTKKEVIECPSCKEKYYFNTMEDNEIQFYANEKKNIHLKLSIVEFPATSEYGLEAGCNRCHCRFTVIF